MTKLKFLFFFFFLLLKTFSQEEIPVLKEFVVDEATIFNESELINLQQKLKDFEIATRNQIVVVSINDLKGKSIEGLANTLFYKNKIGQKDKDNGVLVLISKNDKKIRIEVGYGLEPILTDAISSRIIREIITPEFKKQNFYKGINLGVNEIISIVDNSFKIVDKEIPVIDDIKEAENKSYSFFKVVKETIMLPSPMGIRGFQVPLWFFLGGIILFILLFMFLLERLQKLSHGDSKGYSSSGSSSYSSSSSSISSSSSSNGFSGGGGSSGGGGASGSW